MVSCLVTGGAGFIGSHIVDKLLEIGYEVICYDNESSESNKEFYWNSNACNILGDIRDYSLLKSSMSGVDYVFHLAAHSRIQPALNNPIDCFDVNVIGTTNVLQSSKECGVKKVVLSSTSSSYGNKNKIPLKEDMIVDALNPYSVSKVSAENIAKMYTDLFGLETVSLRYFNVYGDRQPLKGQYAPVIGLFIEQYMRGEPLTIIGDGEQRRDFTHVDDVVLANIACIDNECSGIINIGSGRNYSINEIASMISNNVVFIPPRPAECRETLACIEKAKDVLNWEPMLQIGDWINGKIK